MYSHIYISENILRSSTDPLQHPGGQGLKALSRSQSLTSLLKFNLLCSVWKCPHGYSYTVARIILTLTRFIYLGLLTFIRGSKEVYAGFYNKSKFFFFIFTKLFMVIAKILFCFQVSRWRLSNFIINVLVSYNIT